MVPVHTHTRNSALDGLATSDEIAERCAEINVEAVACTDHDVVAGHPDFYRTIHAAGLKPILGIETYQTPDSRFANYGFRSNPTTKDKADNFHLILVAMNNQGLRNLYAMNSAAHRDGFYYNARVDWELLERYNEGIICTSACALSMLSQSVMGNPYVPDMDDVIGRYLSIFGDRFYVELSTYSEQFQREINEDLIMIARNYGVPLIYANDAHYAFSKQYDLHETVLCMQYAEKQADRTEPHHAPDLYIMDESEIERSFNYLPNEVVYEALDNTDDLASRCDVTIATWKKHTPVFIPEKGWNDTKDMLFDLAAEGYQRRIIDKGRDSNVYMDRFKMEMEVVRKAELGDYFLMVRDVIKYAKNKGYLVGPGRGSVGGSLVAYCLDIHQIDPVKYGLLFERFYNIGREGSLPDIDVDFPTFARDDILAYLKKKYGEDKVAPIGTVSTLQGRAAIQKLGRTLDIPYGDTTKISKIIEQAIQSGQMPNWAFIWKKVGHELKPYVAKYPVLFDYAERLYGHPFAYGVHPSGIIISDEPLAEVFPLRWHAKDKKLVTQWDMTEADKLGQMKLDALGLRNLDSLMAFNEILES